jgi:hypothetical protein
MIEGIHGRTIRWKTFFFQSAAPLFTSLLRFLSAIIREKSAVIGFANSQLLIASSFSSPHHY